MISLSAIPRFLCKKAKTAGFSAEDSANIGKLAKFFHFSVVKGNICAIIIKLASCDPLAAAKIDQNNYTQEYIWNSIISKAGNRL